MTTELINLFAYINFRSDFNINKKIYINKKLLLSNKNLLSKLDLGITWSTKIKYIKEAILSYIVENISFIIKELNNYFNSIDQNDVISIIEKIKRCILSYSEELNQPYKKYFIVLAISILGYDNMFELYLPTEHISYFIISIIRNCDIIDVDLNTIRQSVITTDMTLPYDHLINSNGKKPTFGHSLITSRDISRCCNVKLYRDGYQILNCAIHPRVLKSLPTLAKIISNIQKVHYGPGEYIIYDNVVNILSKILGVEMEPSDKDLDLSPNMWKSYFSSTIRPRRIINLEECISLFC